MSIWDPNKKSLPIQTSIDFESKTYFWTAKQRHTIARHCFRAAGSVTRYSASSLWSSPSIRISESALLFWPGAAPCWRTLMPNSSLIKTKLRKMPVRHPCTRYAPAMISLRASFWCNNDGLGAEWHFDCFGEASFRNKLKGICMKETHF